MRSGSVATGHGSPHHRRHVDTGLITSDDDSADRAVQSFGKPTISDIWERTYI